MQNYRQLEAWQRAMAFVTELYRFAAELPDAERYNLALQLRKAAVSVPLNIAEGSGCATNGDFARFLSYAYRSLKEVETCLELAERLYPTVRPETVRPLMDEADQIARMTYALIQRLGPSVVREVWNADD